MAIKHDAILPYYQRENLYVFGYPVINQDGSFDTKQIDLQLIVTKPGQGICQGECREFCGSIEDAINFVKKSKDELAIPSKTLLEIESYLQNYYDLLRS